MAESLSRPEWPFSSLARSAYGVGAADAGLATVSLHMSESDADGYRTDIDIDLAADPDDFLKVALGIAAVLTGAGILVAALSSRSAHRPSVEPRSRCMCR